MAKITPKKSNLPILYFDGGSRGNPGKAAGAAVIVMPAGEQFTVSKYLDLATNNEAEYTGLIVGLEKAKEMGINDLIVRGDSQLVIKQIRGEWQVKSPNLQEFYQQAKNLIRDFKSITINWVKREENYLADAAANQCMDQGKAKVFKPNNQKYLDREKQESLPSEPKSCYYAQGDVIVINNPLEETIKHDAVIIKNPILTKERKWQLTIEIY